MSFEENSFFLLADGFAFVLDPVSESSKNNNQHFVYFISFKCPLYIIIITSFFIFSARQHKACGLEMKYK